MSNNKIIFAGPQGAGVTTAIKAISDVAPTIKKEKAKDSNGNEITVEMDHGVLKLDTGDQIYICGVSDREKLKYAHETLNKDCIGLVLFINNAEDDPIGTMFQYMDDCQPIVEKKGIAVGLTRYEDSPIPDINEYHAALREKRTSIPVFPVFSINGREKNDIIMMIRALLYNMDSGVN